MRAKFCISTEAGSVTFYRDPEDRKYYGMRHAAGEHNLFYVVKQWLNARGFDVIKKRAQKDGHMLGDQFQPYVRCRKRTSDTPHVSIYSGFYALRGAHEDWNKGEVTLVVQGGYYENPDGSPRQPEWWFRILKLAEQHPDLDCELCGDAKHVFAGPSDALCAYLDNCITTNSGQPTTLVAADTMLAERFQDDKEGLAKIIGTETTGLSLQSEIRAFRRVYGDDCDCGWLAEQAGGPVALGYLNDACPDCGKDISIFATPGDECKTCGHVFWRETDGTS